MNDNKTEPVVLAAMPLADGGQILIKSDGSKVITNGKGQVSVFDKDCNPIGETFPGGSE
jgi:hypothetical protein